MSAKIVIVPLANLATVKPVREVDMVSLVTAAKLFLDGKVGKEAFCYSRHNRGMLRYEPIPSLLNSAISSSMRRAATLIFGKDLEKYRYEMQFLPYLLTKLCDDLLEEGTAKFVAYTSSVCGYESDKNGLTIHLYKAIEYCSYHEITFSLIGPKWSVRLSGCWRGSQQDPGPVYHPPGSCYQVTLKGKEGKLTIYTLSGAKPDSACELWGIDLTRMGVKIAAAA